MCPRHRRWSASVELGLVGDGTGPRRGGRGHSARRGGWRRRRRLGRVLVRSIDAGHTVSWPSGVEVGRSGAPLVGFNGGGRGRRVVLGAPCAPCGARADAIAFSRGRGRGNRTTAIVEGHRITQPSPYSCLCRQSIVSVRQRCGGVVQCRRDGDALVVDVMHGRHEAGVQHAGMSEHLPSVACVGVGASSRPKRCGRLSAQSSCCFHGLGAEPSCKSRFQKEKRKRTGRRRRSGGVHTLPHPADGRPACRFCSGRKCEEGPG